MMKLTLIVGTRNWSSWSLRAWLPVKLSGLPFDQRGVQLRRDETAEEVRAISPSGLVPLLDVEAGGRAFRIWDSLAIAEFVAEIAPLAGLWPGDPVARARARSICAEMHSGFTELRRQYAMDFARHVPGQEPTEGTRSAITRITAIWNECLDDSGGPFLFGRSFSNADAFYAPVVSRFQTYGVKLDGKAKVYAETIWHHPLMREWFKTSAEEVASGLA